MVRFVRVFAFIISGVWSLTFLGAGCGAPAPAPISPRPGLDNGDIANPPRHLSPLREGTWTYDVVDGKGKGQTVTQVVKYDASNVSAPWRRIVSADNAIQHLREEPNGAIVMPAIELLDHGVVNTFDPPVVAMPAPEGLGSPLSVTSQVVTTLRNGLPLGRGTAEVTFTSLGAETLETLAGSFKCRIFEIRVNAKLVLGQVQSSDTLDYADGVGLVAETYSENTIVVFIRSSTVRKTVLKAYHNP
jgi:hypothetical protein